MTADLSLYDLWAAWATSNGLALDDGVSNAVSRIVARDPYRWALDYRPARVLFRFWRHAVADEGSTFGALLQCIGIALIGLSVAGLIGFIFLLGSR